MLSHSLSDGKVMCSDETRSYEIIEGFPKKSDEYWHKLSEVHLRSAKRILGLCEYNKGFYVKAAQFVAALWQVPKDYTSVLSSLQDQAVPCDFKAIKQVLVSNLEQDLSDIFLSLDENPFAATFIAQVHHALLKDHQEVAVKVRVAGIRIC
ncbi:ABC1 atypical kinase-like domain [Dillenia turbinata]|uniref:ABC1 atypical kinase-like domain n=1 Tax=Dillenia turbinata TaxID=194707 RepID=A0AAN8UUT1_9MAGN